MKILQNGDNAEGIAEHWAIQNSEKLREEEKEEKRRVSASQGRVWFLAQRTYGEEEKKKNLKETAFLALLFRTPYLA